MALAARLPRDGRPGPPKLKRMVPFLGVFEAGTLSRPISRVALEEVLL